MSRCKRVLRGLGLVALFPLGGCSAVGGLVGGLTSTVGSLLGVLISLAAVAAPLALSYWLYQRDKE
jgi:hypothetical protein